MIIHSAAILSLTGLLALSAADEVGEKNGRLRQKSNAVGVKGEEQERDMFVADQVQATEVFASEMEVWERLLQDMSASMSMPPPPDTPEPTVTPVVDPTPAPVEPTPPTDRPTPPPVDPPTPPPVDPPSPEPEPTDPPVASPEPDITDTPTESPVQPPTSPEEACCEAEVTDERCDLQDDGSFPLPNACDGVGNLPRRCCLVPPDGDPFGTPVVRCALNAVCDSLIGTDCTGRRCFDPPSASPTDADFRDECCADVERLGSGCTVGGNNIISEICGNNAFCCLVDTPPFDGEDDIVECVTFNPDGSPPPECLVDCSGKDCGRLPSSSPSASPTNTED